MVLKSNSIEKINSNYSDKHFFLHFYYKLRRLPFNSKHPFVYLIVVMFQYIVSMYSFLLLACCLCIGIGAYLFLLSVTADIKRNLLLLNKCAKTQENHQQITLKQLADTIQLHSDSKQFVTLFSMFSEDYKLLEIQIDFYFKTTRQCGATL